MMPFVKLDTQMLESTLWLDVSARDVFITALLMAVPFETQQPMAQLEVRSLKETGFIVPPGWYGMVKAAGIGIIHRSLVEDEYGYAALESLGSPDPESRSGEFDGRRMVRINGGYLILNYFKFREKDGTAAERARRYRESRKSRSDYSGILQFDTASHRDDTASHRNITQAEAEADIEAEAEEQIPSWFPLDSWIDFLEMRRKIRKQPTEHAKELLIDKLTAYQKNGMDVKAILEQSTINCWQDLFPLREERSKGNGRAGKQSLTEAIRASRPEPEGDPEGDEST